MTKGTSRNQTPVYLPLHAYVSGLQNENTSLKKRERGKDQNAWLLKVAAASIFLGLCLAFTMLLLWAVGAVVA